MQGKHFREKRKERTKRKASLRNGNAIFPLALDHKNYVATTAGAILLNKNPREVECAFVSLAEVSPSS